MVTRNTTCIEVTPHLWSSPSLWPHLRLLCCFLPPSSDLLARDGVAGQSPWTLPLCILFRGLTSLYVSDAPCVRDGCQMLFSSGGLRYPLPSLCPCQGTCWANVICPKQNSWSPSPQIPFHSVFPLQSVGILPDAPAKHLRGPSLSQLHACVHEQILLALPQNTSRI